MPEFANTHEQNGNVLITITRLYELSFTSGAGSGCLRQKGCALICYVRGRKCLHTSRHQGSSFCRGSLFKTIFFFFCHMTPIKLEREHRDVHKQRHVFTEERTECFKLASITKENNPIMTKRQTSLGTRCVCSCCGRKKNGVESQDSVLWTKQWNLFRINKAQTQSNALLIV